MGKRHLLFLTAAVMLAAGGCAGQSVPETPAVSESAVILPTLTVTALPTATVAQEPVRTQAPEVSAEVEEGQTVPMSEEPDVMLPEKQEAERPLDEEILDAYRAATEAYGWFAGGDDGELMLSLEDTCAVEGFEVPFYRVTRPGFETLNDLRVYLKTLFSDEVVDALMDTSCFTEREDGLYALGAGRGSEKGPVLQTAVLWPEEGAVGCTVQVTIEVGERDESGNWTATGEQIYEFPYEKVGDKWVFTRFEDIF